MRFFSKKCGRVIFTFRSSFFVYVEISRDLSRHIQKKERYNLLPHNFLRRYLFYLFLLLPHFLYAQYSSYGSGFSNPVSGSILAHGVAFEDKLSALFSNPSLLLYQSRHFLAGSLSSTYGMDSTSPVLPSVAGFYVANRANYGWGIALKKKYERAFPQEARVNTYSSNLFFTYAPLNHLFLSTGIGPSNSFRNRSQSSYSWSYFVAASYVYETWIFGLSYNYTGKFQYENYRSADKLTEVFPEHINAGLHKLISPTHSLYLEVNRYIWERTSFGLNRLEEKAVFDRGLGAEFQTSLGYRYKCLDETYPMTFRGGLEVGGSYSNTGRNLRHLGLGLGVSFLFLDTNYTKDTLTIDLSISDYSMFKAKGKDPETIFLFALRYEFGETY
jgi:hypothetical protein